MITEFNGLKFYSEYYSYPKDLENAKIFLDMFDFSNFDVDINAVLELYTAQKLVKSKDFANNNDAKIVSKYIDTCDKITPYIAKWFSGITDTNFIQIVENAYIEYFDDFLNLFDKFKTYDRISGKQFSEFLNLPDTTLYKILEYPDIVKKYDTEIGDYMRQSSQTARILISKFIDSDQCKYHLPKSLLPNEFEDIFSRYIDSKEMNANVLQLLFTAKSTKECPISDKLKLKAKKRYYDFWENNSLRSTSYGYGVGVSFGDVKNTKLEVEQGNIYHLTYNIKWLEESIDYPTILNNFIYVFEMFNLRFCPSFISVKSKVSALEGAIMVKGKDCYIKGNQFNISNMIANSQIGLYSKFLQEHNIDLEDVFKWFFENYLAEEFGAKGFTFTPSSNGTTYLEKIRNIASEMDGVLKQYRMFVEDGDINRELFEMSSNPVVFADLKSQLSNKYGYINDPDQSAAMFYLFSDQSVLSYTEKTEGKYNTLFELVLHEKMVLSDFKEFQKNNILWLISQNYLQTGENGELQFVAENVIPLKEYFDHDVICLKYQKNKSQLFEKLSIEDSLFSKPEQDYLNFMLNKSEFSDGNDLRNKYIHSTYPREEETQMRDYIDFLKIMILIIVKINEEFCLKSDELKES